MNRELSSFISGIKEKTGVDFAIFTTDGEYVAGRVSKNETVPFKIEKVTSDKKNGKTYFPFGYNGKELVGRLIGCGEIERSYAFFITELATKHKQNLQSKQDFIEALLEGRLSEQKVNELAVKFGVKSKPLFALCLVCPVEKQSEIIEFIEEYKESEDFILSVKEGCLLFVKYLDKTVEDYTFSYEYALFLYRTAQEETGINLKIGVGGQVNELKDLGASYSQAQTTLHLTDVLKSKGNVHTYKEYVLIKMLDEIPKARIEEYLQLLINERSARLFSSKEIIDTAEAFLENNLNQSETARKTFIHRNTLTYRLDKIQNETGLDIRKFSDALTFRLITVLSELIR